MAPDSDLQCNTGERWHKAEYCTHRRRHKTLFTLRFPKQNSQGQIPVLTSYSVPSTPPSISSPAPPSSPLQRRPCPPPCLSPLRWGRSSLEGSRMCRTTAMLCHLETQTEKRSYLICKRGVCLQQDAQRLVTLSQTVNMLYLQNHTVTILINQKARWL